MRTREDVGVLLVKCLFYGLVIVALWACLMARHQGSARPATWVGAPRG